MFRFSRIPVLFFVLLVLLMSAIWSGAVSAQEETPVPMEVVVSPPVEASPGVPVEVVTALLFVFGSILTVGLVAFAYVQNKSVSGLYQSIPSGAQSLIGLALEFFMRQATDTPSALDDKALQTLAETLGYKVERLADGRVILTPPTSVTMYTTSNFTSPGSDWAVKDINLKT